MAAINHTRLVRLQEIATAALQQRRGFGVTTRGPTGDSSPITLIADPASALAGGIAAELAERGHQIQRIGPGDQTGSSAAAVFIIEHATSLDTLRRTLDYSQTPTLVLAATRRLAGEILPLLGARQDLATAADSTDILLWRLERLLQISTCSTPGVAQLDALTGLLNRHAIEQRLRQASESMTTGTMTGLLYLDLDQFKSVNDCLGHLAGDTVLRACGDLLRRSVQPRDLVGRLGGDEFAVLLTRDDTDSIVRAGTQLLQEIAELDLFALLGKPSIPRLTASAGLAFIGRGVDATTLLAEADMAAYQAKSNGRNRLEIYGQLAEAAKQSSRDLHLTHFENVTRVATERLVEMITLKSRRLVDAAKQEANVCSLTGLYNRRYFDAQMSREIDQAVAGHRPLTMAMIDLDDFHTVNTTHGWPTGDRVLQAFAAVARANVRSTDWVARYGGEEFVIVLPNTSLDSARFVVERVRHAFEAAAIIGLEGQSVTATLSAGVAQRPESTVSAVAFVNEASNALLEAKDAGRNRVALAS